MSDSPEIIVLSSDEETKPVDKMQRSKRRKGKVHVNDTASKKIALQFQSACSSKTQTTSYPKPSVMHRNETSTVYVPVNKYQNATQNGNIYNQRFPSRNQSSSLLQKCKDGKLSVVSANQCGNAKSVLNLQKPYKSKVVSNSLHTSVRTSAQNKSFINMKNSQTGNSFNNFIQKSNVKQSENSSKKMNIPFSVLSSLQEKGISITNVKEKPKSNVAVCNNTNSNTNSLLESQKYLNKLKNSLSKSNTNINVVPKTNSASSFTTTFTKANVVTQGSVHSLKNTVKGCSIDQYQHQKKMLPVTRSMSNKCAKYIPFKFSSEIKIIEKPATVTSSTTGLNGIHNFAQKDPSCFSKSSVSGQLTKKVSTFDSVIKIPSRSLSVTPVAKSKTKSDKSIFSPEINVIDVENFKQKKEAVTASISSVTSSNSVPFNRTRNFSVKRALNTNTKKLSPAVANKTLQKSINNHAKPVVTKNVDLSNGRETLLSLLSLCNDNEKESCIKPSYVKPTSNASSSDVSILPVTTKSEVHWSETKPTILLSKSMKLKDVDSKTHNWPRLVVLLERCDLLTKHLEKEVYGPKTVTEEINMSEASDNYSNEQELEKFCKMKSAECHSVKSKDDDLSMSISKDKSESVVLTNCVKICISDDVKNKNSKSDANLKSSPESDSSIMNIFTGNTVTKTLDSSHAASSDIMMMLKKDNNITFDTYSGDPSQCIRMEILTEDSHENPDSLLAVNRNTNDKSEVKSVQTLNKSDIDNCSIQDYDISKSVKTVLDSVISKIWSIQFKEIDNTCMEVLNNIISTIEAGSGSLSFETETVTGIQSACQESIKHDTTGKFSSLLSNYVCKDISDESNSDVHSVIDNNHCAEICRENKERKSLTLDMFPSNEEEVLDSLTVTNHLEETNISNPRDANINICNRTDVSRNPDITNKLSVLSNKPEPLKETVDKTSVTANKNKFRENDTICVESTIKLTTENNRESLFFNHDEQKIDRSENCKSETINRDNDMDYTISSQITANSFSECDKMQSSKDNACFQDDNAIISVSPLRESGDLSCIIVQVESRPDLFTEKEEKSEDDSKFKQNLCIIEEDNMGFNDEERELCMTQLLSEEDTSDKYACSDDERKNSLNLANSSQVTSPKLSLKRNRNVESPDAKMQLNSEKYFEENGLKRIKLEQSALSIGKNLFSPSDKNPVPLCENLEERNKRKFLELLEYSKTLMDVDSSEEEKDKIVKNMIKKLSETQSWYAGSEKFSAQIEYTTNKLKRMEEHSGENVFSILQEMRKEFKSYKRKSKFNVNKENSQDTTNSACFSSVSNDAVDGNNCVSMKEIELNSNFKDGVIQNLHGSHISSTSESAISEDKKFSTFKIKTDEIKDSIETFSHTVLVPETSENSIIVNKTVDKENSVLKPVLLSTIESSGLKNTITDNQYNSLAISPTLEVFASTSNSAVQPVTESITNEKDKTNSSDLSSLQQSLNSGDLLTVGEGITDINMDLHQSSSKDDTCSLLTQNAKLRDNVLPKTSPVNTNCSNKDSEDKANSNLSAFLPVDKVNHAISVLNTKKPVKVETVSEVDRSAVRIEKLEKLLQKLDKKIKKLQEKELTLDDLDKDDSAYVLEEKYKNRFIKAWELLCKVKKQPSRTGRIVDKKFKYEGSRHKEINIRIEKMINKRKAHEKFPDYVEILTLIKQVNEFQNIGLNERLVEIEAERVFRDVGKELQIRRCRDFEDLLGCHLTDNFDPVNDPAEHDEGLRNILNENRQSFEKSINQVIDSYAEKQTVTPEDEDNPNNNSSEDEDNPNNNSSEDEEDQDKKNKDLPLTDPASPNSDSLDSSKSDDNDIEIVNESDKSTDPNEEIVKKKEDNQEDQTELSTTEVSIKENDANVFVDSIVIEDSCSSDDLPSIEEVMSNR